MGGETTLLQLVRYIILGTRLRYAKSNKRRCGRAMDLKAEDHVLCIDPVLCLTLEEVDSLPRGTGPNYT